MAITKEKAIDILERFDLFQGQRAGRELWNDKPFEVQEQDVKDFARDVALLKEYIADVVPKSEWNRVYTEIEGLKSSTLPRLRLDLQMANTKVAEADMAKAEVAREIFEEIEKVLNLSKCYGDSGVYFEYDIEADIAELKKKYIGDKNDKRDTV